MTKADIARVVYERHGGISNREAARLVSAGTRLALKRGPRPLSPGDIAVLVRTHRQGEQVRAQHRRRPRRSRSPWRGIGTTRHLEQTQPLGRGGGRQVHLAQTHVPVREAADLCPTAAIELVD